MDFSDRVKRRRLELGLTQEELGKRMGYSSRSSINKIEKGRNVTQKVILELANALETTPAYLMGMDYVFKGNKNLKVNTISYTFDSVISFSKMDPYLFYSSGLYQLYKNHKEKVDKWLWTTNRDIDKCIFELETTLVTLNNVNVPFFYENQQENTEYLKNMIQSLKETSAKIKDLSNSLFDLVVQVENVKIADLKTANEIKLYLQTQMPNINFDSYEDVEVFGLLITFISKSSEEVSKLKRMLDITDD